MLAKVARLSAETVGSMMKELLNVVTAVRTHEQNTSGQENGVLGLHGDVTFQVGMDHLAKKLPPEGGLTLTLTKETDRI